MVGMIEIIFCEKIYAHLFNHPISTMKHQNPCFRKGRNQIIFGTTPFLIKQNDEVFHPK